MQSSVSPTLRVALTYLWFAFCMACGGNLWAWQPPSDAELFPSLDTFLTHVSTSATHTSREVAASEVAASCDTACGDGNGELETAAEWLSRVKVGYDSGFVIASEGDYDLDVEDSQFLLRIHGWGQLRHALLDSQDQEELNQFQLKRGRLTFQGNAFSPNSSYFLQIDGRSSDGDDIRLLDYVLTFDIGRQYWGLRRGQFGFKAGKYKMPSTMARQLSGKEFEFSDRSVASTFFDVNRSFAVGLYGCLDDRVVPYYWEMAIFNGLVTGGAETGGSGSLDDNFAYSARMWCFPQGDWGAGGLADLDGHTCWATRFGVGIANSTIERFGFTEFSSVRVVDSGETLASVLPAEVTQYTVSLLSVDYSAKYQGWSGTVEYYLQNLDEFQGAPVPHLFTQGFWLQLGKFIIPRKLQLISRWSRVSGDAGTLGQGDLSSEEIAGGFVWYLRDQHAKLTLDATYLDGAPVSSAALDIHPGDNGWLVRSQIQFAF